MLQNYSKVSLLFQVTLLLVNFTQDEHNLHTEAKREVVDAIYLYNRRFSGAPRPVCHIYLLFILVFQVNLLLFSISPDC